MKSVSYGGRLMEAWRRDARLVFTQFFGFRSQIWHPCSGGALDSLAGAVYWNNETRLGHRGGTAMSEPASQGPFVPAAARISDAQIDALASRIRQRFIQSYAAKARSATPPTGGEAVKSLLEYGVADLGGKIVIASAPGVMEIDGGSLMIRGPRDFQISLSPTTSPLRDNFTIGHELGHYMLHYMAHQPHHSEPVVFHRYGQGTMEWQANRFAASLLLPEEDFRALYKQTQGNTPWLAGHFGVSLPATEMRARFLGLL